MLWYTHVAFGLLSSLIIMPFVSTGNKIIFTVLVMLGALLPDIDHPNSKISNQLPFLAKPLSIFTKHRGVFHTIFLAILIPGVVAYFISRPFGLALFIGYFSHLLIDGTTKSGVNFLHPFSKLNISGFIETGHMAEHIVFILIVLTILLKLF